ncbi:AzlD domain-containing protein [Cellulosilyticum sp. I15G10I2]|uniref:AzlD domain-containing protein n=1 Tax=Cellulosilyticum sp. I15G10I2 TaxID=1892843 RepID=UPI00085CC831|nr:AzlD domain-containing protein [Cellulosilyticum sp. I15G10I2]
MYMFIAILVMAIVTYMPRVLPLTLFNKKIKSTYIRSFLHYVPYAVLGAMTFPSVFYAANNSIYASAGVMAAVILGYFKQSLVIVAMAAVGMVYCCNILF